MRYIITATRRNVTSGTVYISSRGCMTFNADRAHIWKDLSEAKKELEYWQNLHCGERGQPETVLGNGSYRFCIEELPLGKNAFLRSKEVAQ